MTPKEYLKSKLFRLSKQFSDVTIKYSLNLDINYHIVELTPQHEYYHNSSLDNAWIPISLEFMQMFPNEYISFISVDSSLKIEQPEFSFNEKQLEHINIREIYTEILNSPLNIDYITNFETIQSKTVFVSYNQTKLNSLETPTLNKFTTYPLQPSFLIQHEVLLSDCELPLAA